MITKATLLKQPSARAFSVAIHNRTLNIFSVMCNERSCVLL